MPTVILGDNVIIDCDAALILEGEEVFRLRERDGDGHLVVDFDLRAPDGSRIAKVAKNYVAYVAPGYEYRNCKGVAEVVERATGRVVARVEERARDTVAVTGTFNVNGYRVDITENGLRAGGVEISRNDIRGFRRAISLRRGSFTIGMA
jgi:hypothetical protein